MSEQPPEGVTVVDTVDISGQLQVTSRSVDHPFTMTAYEWYGDDFANPTWYTTDPHIRGPVATAGVSAGSADDWPTLTITDIPPAVYASPVFLTAPRAGWTIVASSLIDEPYVPPPPDADTTVASEAFFDVTGTYTIRARYRPQLPAVTPFLFQADRPGGLDSHAAKASARGTRQSSPLQLGML